MLSQAELAEIVGVENLAISRIESGEQFVKAETLDGIKKALEVDYASLFAFDDKSEIQNKKLKSIMLQLKSLDDKALDFFLSTIKSYKKM